MKIAIGITLMVGLALVAIGGCDFDPTSWHGPAPASTPVDYSAETSPVPSGFATWQEYNAYAQGLVGGAAGQGGVAGLGQGVTGGAAGLQALDTDGDGLVTLTPTEITQPDGSGALVIGEIPSGSSVTFNDDGTVTISLPPEVTQ
jgi:hypothetical protein